MNSLDPNQITEFVNDHIDSFHQSRHVLIQNLKLKDVLKRKNPYLFRAKNINTASELVSSILEAFLSSSEEGLFGQFLESLAIYINHLAYDGQKSSASGIDFEFNRDGVRYIVAVKSGPNWGNSSQYQALRENFRRAIKVLKQSPHITHVQALLGMCYGRSRDSDTGEYLKLYGQSFWTFISGDPNLYIDIVEPLGHEAHRLNEAFLREKAGAVNRLVRDFALEFCEESGQIDWPKLVRFNSGNLKV